MTTPAPSPQEVIARCASAGPVAASTISAVATTIRRNHRGACVVTCLACVRAANAIRVVPSSTDAIRNRSYRSTTELYRIRYDFAAKMFLEIPMAAPVDRDAARVRWAPRLSFDVAIVRAGYCGPAAPRLRAAAPRCGRALRQRERGGRD